MVRGFFPPQSATGSTTVPTNTAAARKSEKARTEKKDRLVRAAKPHSLEETIRSTVPMGAGLNSSAALKCATARVLQQMWGTNFDDLELAPDRVGTSWARMTAWQQR